MMRNNLGARRMTSVASVHEANSIKDGVNMAAGKAGLPNVAMKPVNKPGSRWSQAEDRGEHGRATHAPDSKPGRRVPEA